MIIFKNGFIKIETIRNITYLDHFYEFFMLIDQSIVITLLHFSNLLKARNYLTYYYKHIIIILIKIHITQKPQSRILIFR